MPLTITPDVPALKGLFFATMEKAMMTIRSQAAKDHVSYKVSDRNKTRDYLKFSCNGAVRYIESSLKGNNDNTEYQVEYSLDNITSSGDIGEATKGSAHWLIS